MVSHRQAEQTQLLRKWAAMREDVLGMLRLCNPQDPNLLESLDDTDLCPPGHPNMCGSCAVRYALEQLFDETDAYARD